MRNFAASVLLAVATTAQTWTEIGQAFADDATLAGATLTGAARFTGNQVKLWASPTNPDTDYLEFSYYYKLGDVEEFHGDFSLYFPNTDMDTNIEYNMCYGIVTDAATGATDYDCMRVRTSVSDIATMNDELALDASSGLISNLATAFDLQDENRTGLANAPSELYSNSLLFPEQDSSASITNDKSLNWRLSANKSTKTGCVESPDDPTKVRCNRITAHFLRNWETIPAQSDDDNYIADDTGALNVIGWVANRADAWPSTDDANDILGGTADDAGLSISPAEGKANFAALTTEQQDALADVEGRINDRSWVVSEPEPEEPDNDSGDSGDGSGDGTGDDGTGDDGTGDVVDEDSDDDDSDDDDDDTTGGDGDDDTTGGDVNTNDDNTDFAATLTTYAAGMTVAVSALLI